MLGLGAIGQFAIGEQSLTTATAEVITVDKWFQPLSEPPRFKPGLKAGSQQALAYVSNPLTVTPFAWFMPLSEPPRFRRFAPSRQQIGINDPLPFVSFSWFQPLSDPPVRVKSALRAGLQQVLAFDPVPFVSFGWFAQLSEPPRKKRSLAVQQVPFTTDSQVIPTTMLMPWFAPLSEPPRFKPGLRAGLQQVLAWPPRVLPTPTVTGVMSANETPDDFLGGLQAFNRVISGEIGVIVNNFTGAQIGVSAASPSQGASGVAEQKAVAIGGSATPTITTAHVAIRVI